jgi:hypothetical protein
MISFQRAVGIVCGLAVLACMLACGNIRQAAERQKTSNDLKQIGLAYHNYNDANKGKGPSAPNDLLPYLEGNQALVDQTAPGGKYVVIWGVSIAELSKTSPVGMSGTVLGYESTAPTAGGVVLMGDGGTRIVTAAEFNTLPKATPSKAAPPKGKK